MEKVKILSIVYNTHDVVNIKTEKPKNLNYKPGQAVDVAIDHAKWKEEQRPFTFTSIPSEKHLEFYIKTYPEHDGVTEQIGKLEKGEYLLLGEVFGAIQYRGEGVFIAGGAGVTPFLSIVRQLKKENDIANNKMIFANKKEEDIIAKDLLDDAFGSNITHILSDEDKADFEHGFVNRELIDKVAANEADYFYLCGPPPMMDAVMKEFDKMGIEKSKIITEEF